MLAHGEAAVGAHCGNAGKDGHASLDGDRRLTGEMQNGVGAADVAVDSRSGAVGGSAIAKVGDIGDLIEHAPTAANHQFATGFGQVSEAEAGSEIMQVARPQATQAMGANISDATVVRNEGGNQVLAIGDGALIDPVQAIVQGQLGSDLPGVLGE